MIAICIYLIYYMRNAMGLTYLLYLFNLLNTLLVLYLLDPSPAPTRKLHRDRSRFFPLHIWVMAHARAHGNLILNIFSARTDLGVRNGTKIDTDKPSAAPHK